MKEKKKTKDKIKYTIRIPENLKILFQNYIDKYPSLGFDKVSQLVLHVLQREAKEILEKDPGLNFLKINDKKYVQYDYIDDYLNKKKLKGSSESSVILEDKK